MLSYKSPAQSLNDSIIRRNCFCGNAPIDFAAIGRFSRIKAAEPADEMAANQHLNPSFDRKLIEAQAER